MTFSDLKNIPKILDSSNHSLAKDFFIPVLSEAITYDRGVGYFTSGWLKEISQAIIPLVERGGKIRLLTSPYLNKDDLEAILLGSEAEENEIIYQALSRSIEQLKTDLREDTRVALSWLIADNIMDIKIAIPKNKLFGGDFHVKFGIFKDIDDSKIMFMGSYNDTAHANINYEELAIFNSFDESSMGIIQQKEILFQRIWENKDRNLRIINVPDIALENIKSLKGDFSRPYSLLSTKRKQISDKPHSCEGHTPWHYQEKAIQAWLDNAMRGVLEMATGTGKTKTALFGLCRLAKQVDGIVTIISCPTKSLVNQWADECHEFNLKPIICSSENSSWRRQVSDGISRVNLKLEKYLTIVSTHETLKNNSFEKLLNRINRDEIKVLLVADECHHLGSTGAIESIYRDYDFTLGLSATPTRFFDDEGTRFVESLLGSTIFTFDLKKAIQEGFLCPYEYYIHQIYLTEEETEKYEEITNKIKQMFRPSSKDNFDAILKSNKKLSGLLNSRAKVLKTAIMKVVRFKEIVQKRRKDIKHTIVFCAPDTKELDKVASMLKGSGIISHRFTGEENQTEKNEILNNFRTGIYQILTSMNIFNEGLDVPIIREAFILSSSTNPTEYVQRRGRVLRKLKDGSKDKAVIHDFIVLPRPKVCDRITDVDKQILRKEIDRAFLFAENSINGLTVMKELNQILDKYLTIPNI